MQVIIAYNKQRAQEQQLNYNHSKFHFVIFVEFSAQSCWTAYPVTLPKFPIILFTQRKYVFPAIRKSLKLLKLRLLFTDTLYKEKLAKRITPTIRITKIFLFNKEKIAIVSWDLYKVTNKINAAIPIIHQVITILDSPIRATINYKNFSKRLN